MFGLFSGNKESFNKQKLKASLKMAVTRMRMQQNKRQNGIKVQRAEIAKLVREEKFESARIKVEQVIRDEYYIEAIDLIMLLCDLLSSRFALILESTTCPADLKEALSTVVWACPRTDGCNELQDIRKQITLKYGKQWTEIARDNSEMAVNQKVYDKLSLLVPEPGLCLDYLKGICDEYELDWEPVSAALHSSQLVSSTLPAYPTTTEQPCCGCQSTKRPAEYPPPPGPSDFPPPTEAVAHDYNDLEARLEALKRQ
ncbi:IST1-like protein [Diplonema papillatum]|nr:IST1-like protein [Diplonema papillatum]|eukprot:gene5684-8672_t